MDGYSVMHDSVLAHLYVQKFGGLTKSQCECKIKITCMALQYVIYLIIAIQCLE